MTPMRLSRRGLLLGAASASVGAALAGFRAEAQSQGAPPRRVVLFFTPHGTVFPNWRPRLTPTGFELSHILEPLADFKSKLVVIDGMSLPAGGPGAPHTRGPAVLFTGSGLADDGTFQRQGCSGGCTFGWNTSHSVDQEIARRLGDVTPYRSLEFGVACNGGFPGAHIAYAGPAQPLPPKQDPYVAFQQLFAGRAGTDAERARELARRDTVLTAIGSDITALRARVGRADLERLEAHAQAVAELRRSLVAGTAACVPPTAPERRATSSPGFRPWAIDRQSELLAASLACGLTRVASLQFRPGENDGSVYDWLGQRVEHHVTTHENTDAARAITTEIYRWYAGRFAYLLQQLARFREADGSSMLDHTLVVWGSEVGDARTHDIRNVPFVLAGGGAAGVRTGQYQRVTNTTNHRLLVSLCHFMGYRDVQRFGLLDTGSGPLPGLLA